MTYLLYSDLDTDGLFSWHLTSAVIVKPVHLVENVLSDGTWDMWQIFWYYRYGSTAPLRSRLLTCRVAMVFPTMGVHGVVSLQAFPDPTCAAVWICSPINASLCHMYIPTMGTHEVSDSFLTLQVWIINAIDALFLQVKVVMVHFPMRMFKLAGMICFY